MTSRSRDDVRRYLDLLVKGSLGLLVTIALGYAKQTSADMRDLQAANAVRGERLRALEEESEWVRAALIRIETKLDKVIAEK